MPQKVIIIFSQQLRISALVEILMPQKVIIMFSQQLRISAVKTPAQHFAMIHGKCSPLTGALTRFLTGCLR